MKITSIEAYKKVKTKNNYIIDVRTQAEYEFLGHPAMSYNIPYEFWTPEGNINNLHFVEDVSFKFSQSDILMIICRSGSRSAAACEELIKNGFKNVFDITDGFEGPKIENKDSIYFGCRCKLSGWQHAGLPYTYDINEKLSYRNSQQFIYKRI